MNYRITAVVLLVLCFWIGSSLSQSDVKGCTVIVNYEQFVIRVFEKESRTTVTDKNGTVATIRYSARAGNYDVRLPTGYGGSARTMIGAVRKAATICMRSRSQITREQATQAMVEYVELRCGGVKRNR